MPSIKMKWIIFLYLIYYNVSVAVHSINTVLSFFLYLFKHKFILIRYSSPFQSLLECHIRQRRKINNEYKGNLII